MIIRINPTRLFVILILFFMMMFFNSAYAFTDLSIQKPDFIITINNCSIDNSKFEYPFICDKGIAYFPMTWDFCNRMNLNTAYDVLSGLSIIQSESTNRLHIKYVADS